QVNFGEKGCLKMRFKYRGRAVIISLLAVLVLAGCQGESVETSEVKENEETTELADLHEIVGIEPGSGTMNIAQETIDEYNLDLELTPSSEPAMLTALEKAIANEEPIIVTLWQPHWIFTEHELKFLEDPKGTLGEAENIHTMVRKGLKED